MKYTEQDLKDEYEQAIKRKGELYAEGYVEGLKDGQNQALNIADVVYSEERTELPASTIPEFGTDEWIDCCEQLFSGVRKSR